VAIGIGTADFLLGAHGQSVSALVYYSCMAKLSGKEIQKLARSVVNETPGGIRYSVLVEKIAQQNPETPKSV
jgi:hypothetical protein